MKKFIGAFALAGMIGFTACGPAEETVVEEPVLEEVTPVPVVTEPMTPPPPPMTTDSAALTDSAAVDSAMSPATTTP
jgi:hypothetical protein